MNATESKRLIGSIRPVNIPVGFCIPVYTDEKDFFVQEKAETGVSSAFIKINEKTADFIACTETHHCVIGQDFLYSFIGIDGVVHYGNKPKMQEYLRGILTDLDNYVFVKLEVLDFLEDDDEKSDVVVKAATLMMKDNPRGALVWAKMQCPRAAEIIKFKHVMSSNSKWTAGRSTFVKHFVELFGKLKTEDLSPCERKKSFTLGSRWEHFDNREYRLIVGRKGSGKSAFLQFAHGFDKPDNLMPDDTAVLGLASKICDYYEKKTEHAQFIPELIWHQTLTGAIYRRNALRQSNPEEFSLQPSSGLNSDAKPQAIPNYVNSIIKSIKAFNPYASELLKTTLSGLSSASVNYAWHQHLRAPNELFSRNLNNLLVFDDPSIFHCKNATCTSRERLANLVCTVYNNESNYSLAFSVSTRDFYEILRTSYNAPRITNKVFHLEWSCRDLFRLISSRVKALPDEQLTCSGAKEVLEIFSKSHLLPSFHNKHFRFEEPGLLHILRNTQMLPSQLLYILSILYKRCATDIASGSVPSKQDVYSAILKAVPSLVNNIVSEYSLDYADFMNVLFNMTSQAGTTFTYRDISLAWNNKLFFNQYFDSPIHVCEKLAEMGAIGQVTHKYKEYSVASFTEHLGNLQLERNTEYCFHPMFVSAAIGSGHDLDSLYGTIIPDNCTLDHSDSQATKS